jgi:hypothetical protein
MNDKDQRQERILLHGRRGSKRWWMLQEMRRMEQQGMHFQSVDAHIFYGYWEEQNPRQAGASVINK